MSGGYVDFGCSLLPRELHHDGTRQSQPCGILTSFTMEKATVPFCMHPEVRARRLVANVYLTKPNALLEADKVITCHAFEVDTSS
jgi:hypothetical protein